MTTLTETAASAMPVDRMMAETGQRARAAARTLAAMTPEARTDGLSAMAQALRAHAAEILAANAHDMAAARETGLSGPLLDRLELTPARLDAMAAGVEAVARIADPVGRELARWTVPSGLDIARVSTPLGVIGVIYESRPNVTADAGALCVRAGNAAILRGGSESLNSSSAIAGAMRRGLVSAGLPEDAIQRVGTTDRAAVGEMLKGLQGNLDVLVPRGGKSLVARVQDEARVPVIGHLEGLCHTYVDASADPDMAREVVVNAKLRRTGICGATETLLVDAAGASALLPPIAEALQRAGCALKGDARACALVPGMALASAEDWRTEYLAPELSVAVVDGVEGAIDHIATYGTGHTEAIIASDPVAAEAFLNGVDAGIVMHNASTQFADGGEFGMGAEIGISTSRLHARGPVGADQLTTFKYKVRGTGQTRA